MAKKLRTDRNVKRRGRGKGRLEVELWTKAD